MDEYMVIEKGEYWIVLNDGEIVCAAKTRIEARQLANCLNQSDKETSPEVSAGALNYLRVLRGLHHLPGDTECGRCQPLFIRRVCNERAGFCSRCGKKWTHHRYPLRSFIRLFFC